MRVSLPYPKNIVAAGTLVLALQVSLPIFNPTAHHTTITQDVLALYPTLAVLGVLSNTPAQDDPTALATLMVQGVLVVVPMLAVQIILVVFPMLAIQIILVVLPILAVQITLKVPQTLVNLAIPATSAAQAVLAC
jgi:hypothetical protein